MKQWMFAFFLFVLGAVPGQAQADTCRGTNLLTQLQKNDPAAFAALQKEGASTPNGRGIFWKIEKDGVPTSYLLGTMHVTDPRVLEMPAPARAAFDAATTVVVETDEIIDQEKTMVALLSRPDLTGFVDGRSLLDFMTPEQEKDLAAALKERGIQLALVSKMRPWMLSSFMAMSACEMQRQQSGVSFLDKQLAESAKDSGKTLTGLETLIEQMTAMDSLPMDFHIRSLVEVARMGTLMADILETMTELYLTGDIGMIMPMMKLVSELPAEGDDGYAAFEERLLRQRNHIMADRVVATLAKGNVFMAVGALHLPGPEGIVELLRQRGYTLTAVSSKS
ncbi:TraB/GumN family protein [Rhizobium sp. CFBP 8762]|uniref:TraB/GumN family protein n=1 Tax=Rhizobium sp. CFBP 8762 TaxID=2775279 RepID=UPI00178489D0|nr:TraB/GumN family protein [Rhizobium sp. CFBP 8762]MBD8555503.1 TraB/GumN family protein [Rhizobium sp. CFBP 8762]